MVPISFVTRPQRAAASNGRLTYWDAEDREKVREKAQERHGGT